MIHDAEGELRLTPYECMDTLSARRGGTPLHPAIQHAGALLDELGVPR